DRSFFFFGFQGTNSTNAAIVTDTVPTQAFRNGDFTAWGTTIYDPLTVRPGPNGTFVRDPFPGNMILRSFRSRGSQGHDLFPPTEHGRTKRSHQ
ncbi:MAG: hypothetical protein QOJ99_5949, partial [Bryobacterales bacterium]|nr:hypothetical protein [Bryobacterales bacterium]